MRTRREQMQAYRFVIRRIVAAVLSGEPETLDRPMRRFGISLFVSAMVAVIGFAAFGIYGLIANPGRELEDNTLVIERGTGSIYVYLEGRLHPVLNITSARLILGAPAEPRTVSSSSLVDTPRGPTLGIPDAPEALPAPDDLLGLPWRVCSAPPTGAQTEPTTTVVIDRGLSGLSALTGDLALYVSAGDAEYLLWNDMRLRIPDRAIAVALALPPRPVPVEETLLNTVTAGPDLAPPAVPGAGQDSGQVLGGEPALIGQVFEAGGEHYQLTRDGLARIGDVTWTLLAADGVTATTISASEAGELITEEPLEPEGFPQVVPTSHPAAAANPTVCTAYVGDSAERTLGTRIEISESTPEELSTGADALEVAQTSADPVRVADRVVIAGGRGALVQGVPHAAAGPTGETLYLLTDQGIRYPMGAAAAEALGYGDVDPVAVPTELLAMVPTGPELNPQAARTEVRPAAPEPTAEPTPAPTTAPAA